VQINQIFGFIRLLILTSRLAQHAQQRLETSSTKFEDVNLGDNRPSQLVRRYGNLYSEGRLEALDALDAVGELADLNDLKLKLLFSIVAVS